jgi:hypothetical protein
MATKIDDQISIELCRKVSQELDAFCVELFKKHNLVRGKASSKYGIEFQYKMEAFANDNISKQLTADLQNEIGNFADKLFTDNGLVGDSNKAKFGSNAFQITIKASKLVPGDNGVNLASQYAQNFRLWEMIHKLPAETLGKKAVINGETVYLAGIDCKRNGDSLAVVLTSKGKTVIYSNPLVLNKYWGGSVMKEIK